MHKHRDSSCVGSRLQQRSSFAGMQRLHVRLSCCKVSSMLDDFRSVSRNRSCKIVRVCRSQ